MAEQMALDVDMLKKADEAKIELVVSRQRVGWGCWWWWVG